MRLNFLTTRALRGFWLACCAMFSIGLTAPIFAQNVNTPEAPPHPPLPSQASAVVPALSYRSPFTDYQAWRPQTLTPWAMPASVVQPNSAATPPLKVVKPHEHGASAH